MEFDGVKLKELREKAGFDSPARFASHVQLSQGVYITGQTIANLEAGRQGDAYGSTMAAIAAALGVGFSDLYCEPAAKGAA
jgi:transcriptional regulator with XRE-family HTH domain